MLGRRRSCSARSCSTSCPRRPAAGASICAPFAYDCDGASVDPDTLLSLEIGGDDLDAYLERPLPLRGDGIDLTDSTLFTFQLVDIELKATPIGTLPSSALGALLTCAPNCAPTVAEAQAADPDGFSDASLGELVREGSHRSPG